MPSFCDIALNLIRAASSISIPILLAAYLIFVTDTQTVSVEKKSVMWRNFKLLYMTDVEKSKIHPHVD